MEIIDIKPIKRINAKDTLLLIPKGKSTIIKTKYVSSASIRMAVSTLNKKGYLYEATEKGLINEMRVTRRQ